MSEETAKMLSDLAIHLSSDDRKISPMQVAAHLLEQQLRRFSAPDYANHGTVNECA